ncbi:phosphoinositide phospholipase C 2-like [Humulus lupulus]|uniref:phosphoinositide phospholipase C 2-like n=1 Tax=Humulus lupulus TaxID=3486 RepID=UPI002B403362|nr:phosphoinositide phospholipase C 2-like [Humulus lupulus]
MNTTTNNPYQKSKQSFKVCFCFKRRFKLRAIDPPEDVKRLFNEYSENGTMTVDHLTQFLKQVQKEENPTKEDAEAIFNSVKHLKIFHRNGLHLHAFFRYLLGDLNQPHKSTVHHDMTAPLSHYYLFTGHNSYLTGNQLSSDSSTKPIINALNRGVRVIELDLWPNSAKNDVEVRHGGTLTSSVALGDCLRAIKEHAFKVSEFPVIITFEDHLPPNLQAKVAEMVTTTFGTMLYCPGSDYLEEFPSPAALKNRVMISTKPPEYRESHHRHESGSSSTTHNTKRKQKYKQSDDDDDDDDDASYYNANNNLDNDDDDDDDEYYDEEENVIPEYKQLIAIHAGKPKGLLQNWLSDLNSSVKIKRLSLSEQELESAIKHHGADIVKFTQRNFLRVYPKGTRFDSSNYNPMLAWMHGAQMVAFNMQGYGKHLWVMQGMFKSNGGCGYVKKPDFLLSSSIPHDVVSDNRRVKMILKVKVYMGEGWHSDFRHTHFDQFSPPDFFARVGIAGVPGDRSEMKKTKAVEDEWAPAWDQEFEFRLSVPELAVLRVEVQEYDTSGNNDFGGQTSLPVLEIKSGIRAVPLSNKKGIVYKNVRLLMKFESIQV